MTIITWTRPAKCKDCKFIKRYMVGKSKRSICTNPKSERYYPSPYLSMITQNDPVCKVWEL